MSATGQSDIPASEFQQWLVEQNAQSLMHRPLTEIEYMLQPFFHKPQPLGANPATLRMPYTTAPPYDRNYVLFFQTTGMAHYAMPHSCMAASVEAGRRTWKLDYEATVNLLFAIEMILNPLYGMRKGGADEKEKVFGTGSYVWWPKLRKALHYAE
jgi:hypothetical protein